MSGFYFHFTARDARRLFYAFIGFEVFLLIMYLLAIVLPLPATIVELFDLDGEANIPAWFSSLQLGLIGILFLLNSCSLPKPDMRTFLFFISVGLGFIFLSMDEAAEFHEKITQVLSQSAWAPRFKGEHGIWIPLYAAIGMLLLIIMRQPLLDRLRSKTNQWRMIVTGMLIIIAGAVGLEIISYQYLRSDIISGYEIMEIAAEEFMEMAGASWILYATLLLTLREL